MNGRRITILIIALAVSAFILWYDLPIEFPWIFIKALKLFLKLSVVLALSAVAYIFAGGKKKPS
jgi:hypothetical protein